MYDIYTDGACSGNPGPAGVGVIICKNKKLIAQLLEMPVLINYLEGK